MHLLFVVFEICFVELLKAIYEELDVDAINTINQSMYIYPKLMQIGLDIGNCLI